MRFDFLWVSVLAPFKRIPLFLISSDWRAASAPFKRIPLFLLEDICPILYFIFLILKIFLVFCL